MKKVLFTLLFIPFFSKAQIITTLIGPNSLLQCGGWSIGMVMDHAGNYYISEECEAVYKVTPAGVITRIAGNGTYGFSGDGGPATAAALYEPMGIAIDNIGNLYIADMGNERIRKIDTAGIITTIAGSSTTPGIGGFSGDGGPATAAQLSQPAGVYVDNAGNIFIADADNGRIREINTAGIINTVAGGGSSWLGDGGPATAAEMNEPISVTFDAAGNMYICDGFGDNRIRKVNTAGIISTVAGTGTAGYNGDGGPATAAEINNPRGVEVDGSGNLYIVDNDNARIRKVNTAGIIYTVAGNGTPGFSGDGGPSDLAEINPGYITVDSSGNIYIEDQGNARIRYVSNISTYTPYFAGGLSQSLYECSDTVSIGAQLSVVDLAMGHSLTWSLVYGPFHGIINLPYTDTSTGLTVAPAGVIYIRDTGYTGNDTFQAVVSDGVTTDTTTVYIICWPTGINAITKPVETITIFPNPAGAVLNILSDNEPIGAVSIFNMLGQSLQSAVCSGQSRVTVDISTLAAGVYFVKINNTEVRKFVKE